MLRYPYENYLKHLLARQSIRATMQDLERLGYPLPAINDVIFIADHLHATRPVVYDIARSELNRWLVSHKIQGMATRSREAMHALDIAKNQTRPRFVMEALVLSGLAESDIARCVTTLVGTEVGEDVVKNYIHYFWNRDAMTAHDWKVFLVSQDPNKKKGNLDAYRDGEKLHRCFIGDPKVALYEVGLLDDLDDDTILNEVRLMAFARLMDVRADPNSETSAKKALAWWAILDGALQRRAKSGSGAKDVLAKLQRVALAASSGTFPDLENLKMLAPVVDISTRKQIPERPSI